MRFLKLRSVVLLAGVIVLASGGLNVATSSASSGIWQFNTTDFKVFDPGTGVDWQHEQKVAYRHHTNDDVEVIQIAIKHKNLTGQEQDASTAKFTLAAYNASPNPRWGSWVNFPHPEGETKTHYWSPGSPGKYYDKSQGGMTIETRAAPSAPPGNIWLSEWDLGSTTITNTAFDG